MKRSKVLVVIFIIFLIGCNASGHSSESKATTENIKLIGHIEESSLTISEVGIARNLALSGNYVYVAIPKCTLDTDDGRYSCNEHWLRAIDISDPTSPVETAMHSMPYPINAMAVSDDYIYVAHEYFGLRVLKMTPESSSPIEIASCAVSSLGEMDDIALAENYAYISGRKCITESDCTFGLWILDVSDPMAPAETGFYDIAVDTVYNVSLTNNHILVVKSHLNEERVASLEFVGSLQRVDVPNPVALTEVSSLGLQGNTQAIAMSSNYVYIAYGQEGLQVVDISNPTNPIEVGFYNTSEGIWSVAIANEGGDYLYVADSKGAVFVLQFTPASISSDD